MNLQRFFDEKGLDELLYEVQADNGYLNLIPTSVVVAAILQTSGEERRKIENILLQLDLRNGDIHHFLRHLAQAMAISYGA